jgi:hypothetical protein
MHFKAANEALEGAMKADAQFAASIKNLGIEIPLTEAGSIAGKSPTGWVWHHDAEPGILQLVPKDQHTNGSIFWNIMHPNGIGGMAIWNK